MWDRPYTLIWLANALYLLAAALLLFAAHHMLTRLPAFLLRTVQVEGELRHVTREQIALIVRQHLKGNFFSIDLAKARTAFRKLAWVRTVSVRRRWPDRLEVVIAEHQPLARWGDIALVNTHGELFQADTDDELPVFYGPGDAVRVMAEQYGKFSTLLKPAGLGVVRIALSPRRAWQIGTDNGMVIELGRSNIEQRLQRFSTVYANTLAKQEMQVTYADLRYPNGFALRGPAPANRTARLGKRS